MATDGKALAEIAAKMKELESLLLKYDKRIIVIDDPDSVRPGEYRIVPGNISVTDAEDGNTVDYGEFPLGDCIGLDCMTVGEHALKEG